MADVLIIDADEGYASDLTKQLGGFGYSAAHVRRFKEARGLLCGADVRLVILAERAESVPASTRIPLICSNESAPEVLVMADSRDPDRAEAAILAGAWNYFAKPVSILKLKVVVQRVLDKGRRQADRCPVALKRKGIIGNARPLEACLEDVARAAGTEANVLITGETGTGKELFARAIHDNSRRQEGSFVVVDCAALPVTLAESMLFGHERGAFTSAESRSVGMVRQAHQGTLFLDEVGELPASVQKVFLRVLESRRFRPVGATREVESDFRLVSATNRDLDRRVGKGLFRGDLLYRLRSVAIELPPLRNITEDINELVCYHIGRLCSRLGLPRKGFSPDFLDALMNYPWPGNIRELYHAVDQAVSMAADEPILFPRHLPKAIRAVIARSSLGRVDDVPPAEGPGEQSGQPPLELAGENLPPLKQFRAEHLTRLERMYLERLLAETGGDLMRCLAMSGLSRARFYALLSEHGLRRDGG